MNEIQISKFMSLVLRHEPGKLGVTLDSEGWTDFGDFSRRMSKKFGLTITQLTQLVEVCPKQRFVIRDGRIRANQGHSVIIELGLVPQTPPAVLFHGTTETAYSSIAMQGLRKRSRNHVHLSSDLETARRVAVRRKGPWIILSVAASRMASGGHEYFLSENGVWLTDHVEPEYLTAGERWSTP